MKLTVEGASAYAYTGGKALDATLPCVVFVHGALHDHSVWTLLARWFANHGHAVLAVDLPGHGQSEGPARGSVEALADWILALLDAAGVQQSGQVRVVGHSMGSLIGLEMAARAPQRIGHLAMVGTAYPMKVSAALLDTARQAPFKAIDMVNAFSISTLAAKPSYPGPGMWLHGSNRALMRRVLQGKLATGCEVNLFHHDFSVCDRYANGHEAAQQVQCPVTLILGQQDQMTSPKATADLAARLKARTVMLASGHSLQAEAPDELLAALRQALA
jgi:pimeloyl-ACP methyl ester carboxylesterase